MRKITRSLTLFTISLLLLSCSSDDTTIAPPTYIIERTPYLSEIQESFYNEPDEQNPESPQTKLLDVSFKLEYDADFKLTKYYYEDLFYQNDEGKRTQSLVMHPIFDKSGKLQSLETTADSDVVTAYTYVYDQDLLQSVHHNLIAQGGEFTSKYKYNDKKQLIENNSLSAGLLVDYKYNDENQINRMKLNGQWMDITYDDKKTPFYNLPIDLTTDLISFNYILPYTYKFQNNITSLMIGGDKGAIDYTYNEFDLPIKAVFYEGTKEDNITVCEITYSYIIKETKIEQ